MAEDPNRWKKDIGSGILIFCMMAGTAALILAEKWGNCTP